MARIMTDTPEPRYVEKANEVKGISKKDVDNMKEDVATMKTKLATIPAIPTVEGEYKLVISSEGVASWEALS